MKVLVFTPYTPVPCYFGAQRRILELLSGLQALDMKVHLAGCELLSPWSAESVAWLKDNALCSELSVFRERRWALSRFVRRARRYFKRRWQHPHDQPQPLSDLATRPMRRWFDELLECGEFDRVVIHYAWFTSLVADSRRAGRPRSILESQDLLTVNEAMRLALDPYIGPGPAFTPASMPEEALDLRFYDSPRFAAHASEFTALDRFDVTLAITETEASAMRAGTRRTQVLTVPTPANAAAGASSQGQLALLPMGPHPFNLQGYAWFVRRVLPHICAECPDFELSVTGILYRHLALEYHPKVRILGYISDAAELWKLGRMLVNPVFGGTGQPVKTIEAMAAGLPPVILERFAAAAPVIHGVNGFIARDEAEFAGYCVRLWRDPRLCREMGRLAMEAVRNDCSRDNFARQLEHALDA